MKRSIVYLATLVIFSILNGCSTPPPVTSDMLAQEGLQISSFKEIVDKNVNTQGWQTDQAVAGAYLKIDVGADKTAAYTQCRIYAPAPGYKGNYAIQYSDDGITYKNAATEFVPANDKWNEKKWDKVGQHRYWRLLLANTPGRGPWLNELELQ